MVRILERARDRVVGRFEIHDGRATVTPYDPRLDAIVRIADGKTKRARENEIVEARLTAFPDARRIAHGEVEERIGFLGEPGVDIEIVLRSHGLPTRFPEPVVAESELFPEEVLQEDLLGRRDFRDRRIVTIDGETARDFDDAVEVERRSDGFRLGVHIADVSHYVTEGSILDDEARSRGTSVYFPGRVLPMLPERLSNGLCSLNPRVDRLVLSAVLDVDAPGESDARGVHEGCDPQRAPHDLHGDRAAGRDPAERGGRDPVRAVPRGLPKHGGARGPPAEAARVARVDRLRSSGRGHRPRRRRARGRDRAGVAQRRAPAHRGVHARRQRGRGEEAALRQAARDLSRARQAGPGPSRRPPRGPRELRLRAQGRPRGGAALRVPEAAVPDRRQAGGEAARRPAPARAAQGRLQRGVPRPLRARRAVLLPLHVADPPLSGPDRAPAAHPPARPRTTGRGEGLRGDAGPLEGDRGVLVATRAPGGTGGAGEPALEEDRLHAGQAQPRLRRLRHGRDIVRPVRDPAGLLRRGAGADLRARQRLLRVRGEAAPPPRPQLRDDLSARRPAPRAPRRDRRDPAAPGLPAPGDRRGAEAHRRPE